MDGLRGYPDESEPRWYEPERHYPEPEWHPSGEQRFGDGPESSGRYAELADLAGHPARYAEPRQAEPVPRAPEGGAFDIPRSYVAGPRTDELPPAPPAPEEPLQFHTQPIDRAALRRPPAPPVMASTPQSAPASEAGGAVYRTRRVGVALLLIVVLVALELIGLRAFFSAAIAAKVAASGVVSSTLLLLGLPLFTIGLYGLATGAASPAALQRGLAWLRAPLAYLPVGLVLLLGAAIAA